MGSVLIAFLLAIGASGWIYSKIHERTGGSASKSWITAATSGLALFIIFWILLELLI
jgi:hypothetical protein